MAGICYIPVHYRQYQARDQVSVVDCREMASLRYVHHVNVFDGQVIFYFSKKSFRFQNDITEEFGRLLMWLGSE